MGKWGVTSSTNSVRKKDEDKLDKLDIEYGLGTTDTPLTARIFQLYTSDTDVHVVQFQLGCTINLLSTLCYTTHGLYDL